ncbi:MAG: hypothetical protein HZA37_02655 [Parcubacteria group bacterium]|nr:hypothetical protein [Parcubacteria group bacterium]
MKAKLISFVISEATRIQRGKIEAAEQIAPAQSAPHYFETTVPRQFILNREKISIQNRQGELSLKIYQPDVLLAEASFDLEDIFGEETFDLKEKAIDRCRDLLRESGGKNVEEFSEEYSIFVVYDYRGDADQFLKHRERIAGLLKSEKGGLDPDEVAYTLSAQLKYGKNDSVIVDWDGAFVFDPEGDFEPIIELFQLANAQLLRYRVLDGQLDERLKRVVRLIRQASPVKPRFLFRSSEISQALKDTMLVRARSVYEFQALEREIKLIGDWYSARLYDLTAKKFKMEEWRRAIKDKLDAVESVYKIASENFTISWERRGRIIELFGWYVLLFGWLILLGLEIYFFRK